MRLFKKPTALFSLGLFLLLPWPALGQTLSITNGIHAYASLSSTSIGLGGHSELHFTASSNPIPGCLINLTSPDGWLFFSNIRPSTVAATLIGQIQVNGAPAVSGTNVRIDQYAMGTVVIAQPPGFLPLQVFCEPHFMGASASLDLHTYHTGAGLGGMNDNISSFRLKRGYMATFAQNSNGTGISQVYVAQNGDLDVGIMPGELDDSISFVRVFPWRWSGKKGWAGAPEMLVDPLWSYDWDNVATSSTEVEYVPMRHNANWNAYANINNKQKSTHALGFNEPDRVDQANMTVAAAIAQWPNLLASGLRLGAPGVSDSFGTGVGTDWLYSFMAQADALNYRVDYVPIHWYKCDQSASQLYSYLLDVHEQTGRPVWVTEFNNGANWCGGTPPTLAQNATRIGEFIDMLDNAPFVERYAIYNWVGAERELVTGGSLTPAGVVYRDNASPLAYVQEVPAGGARGIGQYPFENHALDGSGYANHALPARLPNYVSGQIGQAIDLDGVADFVQLPPNVAHSTDFSFAAWVYWDGGAMWQRILDFGNDADEYMFLTPRSGGETLRFAITTGGWGTEQRVETSSLPIGQWTHVAFTLNGNTGRLYVNGALAAGSGSITLNPSSFNPARNYLGNSQFDADPLFNGKLDEVLITDYPLTAAQVAALLTNQPPQFATNVLMRPDAGYGQPYNATIAGEATDPDAGDVLTYSKAQGSAWLIVNPDGTLTGTPGAADNGTNTFTVRATDFAGAAAFAVLKIHVDIQAVNIPNGGFELPVTATYEYNPNSRFGKWTFSGSSGNGSGVSANDSAFTAGNSPAPEGAQVAFVQSIASMTQPIPGFLPGAGYTVSFLASQRQNRPGGQPGQTFDVTINGAVIGSFEPSQAVAGYVEYATNFVATSTTHAVGFVGTDLNGGDNTVLLDDVRIILTTLPAVPVIPTNLLATAGDGQVALQWNAAADATTYTVKRARVSGGPFGEVVSGLPLTNHTDLGVTNGATYYYVVSAVGAGGESGDSTEASAHPLSSIPPQVSVGVHGSEIEIAWPVSHTGWQLETNATSIADPGAWHTLPGGAATNHVILPVDPSNTNVFYRLVYP